MLTTYTNQFNEGDIIRGYDFPGRKDCYIEGIVTDANFEQHGIAFYKLNVTKRVSMDEDVTDKLTANLIPHEAFFHDRIEPGQRVVKIA